MLTLLCWIRTAFAASEPLSPEKRAIYAARQNLHLDWPLGLWWAADWTRGYWLQCDSPQPLNKTSHLDCGGLCGGSWHIPECARWWVSGQWNWRDEIFSMTSNLSKVFCLHWSCGQPGLKVPWEGLRKCIGYKNSRSEQLCVAALEAVEFGSLTWVGEFWE